jgi:hypothetical protein
VTSLGIHGPTVVPYKPWGNSKGNEFPYDPGDYGRYIVVDLDENNRFARKECERRTGREPASFGFGICRQGFGRQVQFDGCTEEVAHSYARCLNRATVIEMNAEHAPTGH